MSTANKSRNKGNFERCSITHREAYQRYADMKPRPTLRGLAAILQKEGHKVSEGTIIKWSKKHQWGASMRYEQKRAGNAIIQALEVMKGEGIKFTPEMVSGLQARAIAKLGESLANLKIETPDDFMIMLDGCEKLRGLAHQVRGEKFTGAVAKATEEVKGQPVVKLPSFKVVGNRQPPPTTSNGNGEAHE